MQKKQVPCRWDLDIMFLELPFSPHIMSYSLTIYVFKFHFAVAVVKNDNVIANAHTGVCHIYIQVCTPHARIRISFVDVFSQLHMPCMHSICIYVYI